MPKPKPFSQYLGNGRGAFRKAFLSLLLQKYSENNALDLAKTELGDKCVYCGISSPNISLQPDFLWPQDIGGVHVVGNIVPACPTCNSKRGNQDWKEFMKGKYIKRSGKSLVAQIELISGYMVRHKMDKKPDIKQYLSKEEINLRKDLDIILDAVSQGLRAKIGDPQKKAIKFRRPDILFDKLVLSAKMFLITKNSSKA